MADVCLCVLGVSEMRCTRRICTGVDTDDMRHVFNLVLLHYGGMCGVWHDLKWVCLKHFVVSLSLQRLSGRSSANKSEESEISDRATRM